MRRPSWPISIAFRRLRKKYGVELHQDDVSIVFITIPYAGKLWHPQFSDSITFVSRRLADVFWFVDASLLQISLRFNGHQISSQLRFCFLSVCQDAQPGFGWLRVLGPSSVPSLPLFPLCAASQTWVRLCFLSVLLCTSEVYWWSSFQAWVRGDLQRPCAHTFLL